MKQIEFNKTLVGRFYFSDLVSKDILKQLKNRGEQNGKNEKDRESFTGK